MVVLSVSPVECSLNDNVIALQIILSVKKIFEELPTLVDVSIPKVSWLACTCMLHPSL